MQLNFYFKGLILRKFKKYIALLGLVVLLGPSIIQLHHAFEEHKHDVCISKTEKHFHDNDEIDCSLFHYQLKINSIEFVSNYDILLNFLDLTTFNELPIKKKVIHLLKKSSRAPPTALI